jgi:hypothetical protein
MMPCDDWPNEFHLFQDVAKPWKIGCFLSRVPPSLSQRRETYERIARGRDFIETTIAFRYAGTETKERTP